MKYAAVLVKDYPDLNNQTFTYKIPDDLEDKVSVGSSVIVPFGLKETLRLGYILKINEEDSNLLDYKEIYSVESAINSITEKQIRFLEFVSLYFFIPLSNLFEFAHLFPKDKEIKKIYKVKIENLDKIGRMRKSEKIKKYLLSHKDGFSEELFRRRFKLKKSSTILKSLEKNEIISKEFYFKEEENKEKKPAKEISQGIIKLLNGIPFKERVEEYKKIILYEKAKNVLIITPNIYISEYLEKGLVFTFDNLSSINITYGSKFSILELREKFDLIIIEDIISSEYKIDKPLDFDLEKVASIRAMELGDKIIFDSFIPTILSFQSLRNGRIRHLSKSYRVNDNGIEPKIKILDLRKEIAEHGYFDIPASVQKEIKTTLKKGKKTLIFVNRKGYYNLLICKKCGYVINCPICSIPLTYHMEINKLSCRYCGFKEDEFYTCPSCGGVSIRYASAGTEKYEKKAKQIFNNASVLRIDKEKYSTKLTKVPEFQIAVGTSLSLSVLDFTDIETVVLMGMDTILNMPAYNAYEETLYLIARIYERLIGKNEKKIIIPTFVPHSEIFQAMNEVGFGKLANFYNSELSEREKLRYPPFCDFFQIDLESYKKDGLVAKSEKLYEKIKDVKDIEIVNINPLLSQSPYGIYRGRIIIKSSNILNERNNLGILIDEIRKEEKVNVKIKSLG